MSLFNAQVDYSNYSDNAIGELLVSADEADNMRLAIARALGMPEPVLYDDCVDEANEESLLNDNSSEAEDVERTFNDVLDIQERMANGMKMIQQCNAVLDAANSGKCRLPYKAFMAWKDRRSNLWTHWFELKAVSDSLIGEKSWMWPKYFELADSVLDCNGYSGDVNLQWLYDLDDQKTWNSDGVDNYQD